KEIVLLLGIGGLCAAACYPISGVFLDRLPIGFSIYSRFVAPWVEEAVKGLAIVLLFRANRIGYKLDAVISGFAIGAGFSVIENMIYLVRFPDYGAGTWLVRGLAAAMFAPLAIIGIFSFGTGEAQKWLEAESAEHRAQLEVLTAGGWPDGAAGTRIAALADRLGPEAARHVRRYWQLKAYLVAEAE